MWPSKKSPEQSTSKGLRRLVAGLIISGAIGSILGKNGMDEIEPTEDEDQGDEDYV